MTAKARRVIVSLFDAFFSDPTLMPDEHRAAGSRLELVQGPAGRARAVADYIAGMTDRYAILEHRRLFDPAERPEEPWRYASGKIAAHDERDRQHGESLKKTCCCAPCCGSRPAPPDLADAPGRPLSARVPATRARAGGFLQMCTNPEIACEITCSRSTDFRSMPPSCFGHSDDSHAMNLGLEFEAGDGPNSSARFARRPTLTGSSCPTRAGTEVRDRRGRPRAP